jgi:hypothetical protein
VVFDEERASYISSTDYTARDIAGHHARLLAEHESAALAAADTQSQLLESIRELEAAVIFHEGELQNARDVEAHACMERDDAQRACAQLQYQVLPHACTVTKAEFAQLPSDKTRTSNSVHLTSFICCNGISTKIFSSSSRSTSMHASVHVTSLICFIGYVSCILCIVCFGCTPLRTCAIMQLRAFVLEQYSSEVIAP